MTDEQMDRLIAALSGDMEIYVTVGIALASIVLGFIGGLLTDHISRKRAAKEKQDADERAELAHEVREREDLAREMTAWCYRFAAMPHGRRKKVLSAWANEYGLLLARLGPMKSSGRVANEFLALTERLTEPPADGVDYTAAEMTARATLAIQAQGRLSTWAREGTWASS